jgi:hypothetical protein
MVLTLVASEEKLTPALSENTALAGLGGVQSTPGAIAPFSSMVNVRVLWTPHESRNVPLGYARRKSSNAPRISHVMFVKMSCTRI